MGKNITRKREDGRNTRNRDYRQEIGERDLYISEKHKQQREEYIKQNPIVPLNPKQRRYMELLDEKKCIIATGFAGCVDADTEFLSESGWKRMADYVVGDKVMQVSQEGLLGSFVDPVQYIKRECDWFYHFKTHRGIDQVLSEEHHVAYTIKDRLRLNKVLVADLVESLDYKPNGFLGKIPCIYRFNGNSLGLSDWDIRLGVAIKADAHLASETTGRYVFRLKKERKVERLKWILENMGRDYKLRHLEGGYTEIQVYAPEHTKNLADWMFCSKEDAEIIMSEYQYWDGDSKPVGSRLPRFSTSRKTEADAMQYFANICGYRASVTEVTSDCTFKHVKKVYKYEGRVMYTISFTKQTHIRLTPKNRVTGEIVKPDKIPSVDGYKYCFEVPSGFLLLRRNGKVFVTGNTSKTYIPTAIFADLYRTGKLKKIVLIRPAVSNSKSLGYFAGTIEQKSSVWLAPVIDVLYKRLGRPAALQAIANGDIEFVPMETVKGRSFDEDTAVIVTEAEDCTKEEIMSLLTRQNGCKMVIEGDVRQSALREESGLKLAIDLYMKHKSLQETMGLINFDDVQDIVRSPECKIWIKVFVKEKLM
ncbi:hypothetical protein [Acinetobacter phage P577]|uniref:PhoH-like phosphate starvation-inducible n=1 Tax=Acinetobacter phage YMC13/03/R2096 TaxID=1560342 RepID=UPI00052AD669|nr:PhoH-like phosphate starvation-inducible [Acinetobacter phage YMC13/03/R2096]AIW02828.1 putative phosphate starvation-inducible protein [Acinetobacter phage YMC13/03/R2096]WNT46152.1 hypothetical protein [Acinetobacter phage P577]